MLFTDSSPFACGQIELAISAGDRAILQPLARQVAEMAAQPLEEEKRHLWLRHNALQPTRPWVFTA